MSIRQRVFVFCSTPLRMRYYTRSMKRRTCTYVRHLANRRLSCDSPLYTRVLWTLQYARCRFSSSRIRTLACFWNWDKFEFPRRWYIRETFFTRIFYLQVLFYVCIMLRIFPDAAMNSTANILRDKKKSLILRLARFFCIINSRPSLSIANSST